MISLGVVVDGQPGPNNEDDNERSGDTTTETWYAAGDTTLTTPLRTLTTVANAAGEPVSAIDVANPGGSQVQLSHWTGNYDDLGRLTTSSQGFYAGNTSGAENSPVQDFSYGYTNNGVRNSMTLALSGINSVTTTYAVDNVNRTKGVTQTAKGQRGHT